MLDFENPLLDFKGRLIFSTPLCTHHHEAHQKCVLALDCPQDAQGQLQASTQPTKHEGFFATILCISLLTLPPSASIIVVGRSFLAESEVVSVRISHPSEQGIDLLPEVLRQLKALMHLLTEFAADPRTARVEFLSLSKNSDLIARLRVVNVPRIQVSGSGAEAPTKIKGTAQPLRRLEKVYQEIIDSRARNKEDLDGLIALRSFAADLSADVATITTSKQEIIVSSSIVEKINSKIGATITSFGSIAGKIEAVNIHSRPWSFTL